MTKKKAKATPKSKTGARYAGRYPASRLLVLSDPSPQGSPWGLFCEFLFWGRLTYLAFNQGHMLSIDGPPNMPVLGRAVPPPRGGARPLAGMSQVKGGTL